MATTTYSVLGQAMPAANSETTIFTASQTDAIISALIVCNQSSSPDSISVRVAIGGAADTDAQYIFYNTTLNGNSTVQLVAGLTMATNDQMRVTSLNGTSSFNLFGQQDQA